MEAVILAGGKGTRLYPYTAETPKPLVPIGNRPIIEILLLRLKKAGVTRAHLALNHLAGRVVESLGDGRSLGIEIKYSFEEQPLGTVGPLTLIESLPEHFIVANGDVISDIDISDFVTFHNEKKSLLTVAVQRRTEQIDYGVLKSWADGQVIEFTEKPSFDLAVSMGIYVFSREVLKYVPRGESYGFDTLILKLLKQRIPVFSYRYDGFWLDIGRPADYERAMREIDLIEKMLA